MTTGERDSTADRQAGADAPSGVVLVAADAERQARYESALRMARISARVTADPEQAEAAVGAAAPAVLVLDRGLQRLLVFRLFSLVRGDSTDDPTQVVFVGQGGDTGPDEHYLQGEPSALEVVEAVSELLERGRAAPADAAPVDGIVPEAQHDAPAVPDVDESERPSRTEVSASPSAPDVAAAPSPRETMAVPTPVATNGTAASEAETIAEADAEAEVLPAPVRAGRRLDVILIRIGLVLLILGAVLIFIQSDAFPRQIFPGSSAPVPTRRPTASPKPGALMDGVVVAAVLPERGVPETASV